MSKTYRGSEKDKLKEIYRREREEKQTKRHIKIEKKEPNDRRSEDE